MKVGPSPTMRRASGAAASGPEAFIRHGLQVERTGNEGVPDIRDGQLAERRHLHRIVVVENVGRLVADFRGSVAGV